MFWGWRQGEMFACWVVLKVIAWRKMHSTFLAAVARPDHLFDNCLSFGICWQVLTVAATCWLVVVRLLLLVKHCLGFALLVACHSRWLVWVCWPQHWRKQWSWAPWERQDDRWEPGLIMANSRSRRMWTWTKEMKVRRTLLLDKKGRIE